MTLPQPSWAQDSERDVIGPMLEAAEEAYTAEEEPPERPADCPVAVEGEVVVICAPVEQDSERYRVTSRLERGDDSHLSWSGEAPNVAGPGIFSGPATVGGLCFIPPCPEEPAYFFDITALPEAPPGSDADRIARGLAPRGSRYDEGEGDIPASDAAVTVEGTAAPDE